MGENEKYQPLPDSAEPKARRGARGIDAAMDPLRTELRAIAECIADVRNEKRIAAPTPFGVPGSDSTLDALVGKLANKFGLYGSELRSFVDTSASPACMLCGVKGRPLQDSHCEACRVVKGLSNE